MELLLGSSKAPPLFAQCVFAFFVSFVGSPLSFDLHFIVIFAQFELGRGVGPGAAIANILEFFCFRTRVL